MPISGTLSHIVGLRRDDERYVRGRHCGTRAHRAGDICPRTGALRIDCRYRHGLSRSGRARCDGDDHARRDEPVARHDVERNRRLQLSERRRRHLSGRGDAAGLSDIPRAATSPSGSTRPFVSMPPDGRRAAGVGAGVGRCGAAADRNGGGADADDEPAVAEPVRSTAAASRAC